MVSFSKLPGMVAFSIVVLARTLGSAAPAPEDDSSPAAVADPTPVSASADVAPAAEDSEYVQS